MRIASSASASTIAPFDRFSRRASAVTARSVAGERRMLNGWLLAMARTVLLTEITT
jgi:hypothetical protein